jgi:hypothetical protein
MVTSVSDSYVATVEAADAFFATKQSAATWSLSTTTSAIKAKALQEATQIIDSLPLAGYRFESEYIKNGAQYDLNQDGLTQTLQFPRVIDGVTVSYDYGTDLPIVPQSIKDACCWEALAIVETSNSTATSKRRGLQQQGVKSFSMGDLSESYSGVSIESQHGLQSDKAYKLLRKFLEESPVVL